MTADNVTLSQEKKILKIMFISVMGCIGFYLGFYHLSEETQEASDISMMLAEKKMSTIQIDFY